MSADDFQEVEGMAPAATYAAEPQPQMAMGPSGPQPADPRLYRFFWCAMACAIGVLFPFTSSHPEWKADTFNRALMGPSGTDTFFGALIGFFSVLTAAQYWWCMKYRKVKLWPLILMVMIAVGAWTVVVQGSAARLAFDWKDKEIAHAATAVPGAAWGDIRFWNSYFTHVGAGWLLVLIGSTTFSLSFIAALVGSGKKKGPAPAPAARRR